MTITKALKASLLGLLMIGSINFAKAEDLGVSCDGHFVNPISDICWSCLFPITIGKIPVVPSAKEDTLNPYSPVQVCPMNAPPYVRIGMAIGYWEPDSLVDVTRVPYCMVNLGGINMGIGFGQTQTTGKISSQSSSSHQDVAIYHVHWYKYPLMYWLQLIMSSMCLQTGGFDIAYMTEIDPTWNDDNLNIILNPEVALFSNPITQMACAADAIKTTVPNSAALDPLFWCIGNQGSAYPYNGYIQHQVSPIQASLLAAERMDFKLHREFMIKDSIGVDYGICFEHFNPVMPKSRYRYQMVNTIPDAAFCHPFGHTTELWGVGHDTPAGGSNFGYLIWKKRNCVFL